MGAGCNSPCDRAVAREAQSLWEPGCVGGWPPCSLGFREDICVSRMFGAERIMEQKLESPGWRLGMADRSVWLKWARKGGRGKKREAEEVSKVVASNRPWESVEEFLLGQ